jgi:hypothetical protein
MAGSKTTNKKQITKQIPWPQSASELCRTSDRRLSAKLVPTFADRGYRVVNATDSCGLILGFLDRRRYFFFQVAPQLYSRGWMEPAIDSLILRKSGSTGNRTRTSGLVARTARPQRWSGWKWLVGFTPLPLYPREEDPVTPWIGDRLDLRASLNDKEKWKLFSLPGLELRPHCRPAYSQSLYRLRYRGGFEAENLHIITWLAMTRIIR